ncbi:hypothetical protein TL16_g07324 [Triparma laevis f. inornata]|uniref:Yippee/Mis18/Cereblon domain-containing protein n=2 Tax=Triparma laevis TaxID=1534972 RepID=A0A9W7DLW6_9STRA|nr:hypothetical protein TrLO_g4262 [Triparma laevis f. longispina]GMH77185.1 hypothetical protein TL16_g07324 [Triparma laevis f. inornata]
MPTQVHLPQSPLLSPVTGDSCSKKKRKSPKEGSDSKFGRSSSSLELLAASQNSANITTTRTKKKNRTSRTALTDVSNDSEIFNADDSFTSKTSFLQSPSTPTLPDVPTCNLDVSLDESVTTCDCGFVNALNWSVCAACGEHARGGGKDLSEEENEEEEKSFNESAEVMLNSSTPQSSSKKSQKITLVLQCTGCRRVISDSSAILSYSNSTMLLSAVRNTIPLIRQPKVSSGKKVQCRSCFMDLGFFNCERGYEVEIDKLETTVLGEFHEGVEEFEGR